MCKGDSRIKSHNDAQLCFKGPIIWKRTSDCMYNVYIAQQLANAPFFAMQAYETTEVSCTSQTVIVLHYMVNNTVTKKLGIYWGEGQNSCWFIKCHNGVSWTLNVTNKPITYEGAIVLSGGVCGLQTLVKGHNPNALWALFHISINPNTSTNLLSKNFWDQKQNN